MKWIYGLLCLFFLILFHEFGHFIAAKIFGVKVEAFSIGFGPVLLHKKIKGTDFRLSLFPLGGYCSMKGEKDFQKALEENQKEISGDADSLYGIHPVKRAAIGFAGPFFNFIFAVLAYSIINFVGYDYYTYSNKVLINENVTSSVAKDAGIISGDKIIQINNKKIEDFSEIIQEISSRPDEDLCITIDRDGNIFEINLHSELDKESGTGKIGISADSQTLIKKSTPKMNVFSALAHGFLDTVEYISLTFKSIGTLFKGVNVDNAISGPARVTDLLGTTVKESFSEGFKIGMINMLYLMGIISISLFIMNLLPIPVLDGGLILFAFIEFIIRRKINPKIQYYFQFVGIAFIAVLFIIGLKGDIKFFLNK